MDGGIIFYAPPLFFSGLRRIYTVITVLRFINKCPVRRTNMLCAESAWVGIL